MSNAKNKIYKDDLMREACIWGDSKIDIRNVCRISFIAGALAINQYDTGTFKQAFAEDNHTGKKPIVMNITYFGNIEYDVSSNELDSVDSYLYREPEQLLIHKSADKIIPLSNLGCYITKKTSSLERLVSRIVTQSHTSEEAGQRLLDFVSEDIEYFHIKRKKQGIVDQNLKTPYDILDCRKANCSGKTILYASLLEQSGIEYVIVYLRDHTVVAITGDFPNNNKMSFYLDGKKFYFAETTCPGFRIGKTCLRKDQEYSIKDANQIQFMGKNPAIYDLIVKRWIDVTFDDKKLQTQDIRIEIR